MKRKNRRALKLNAEQAVKVLHHLIAEGKLAASDVMNALKRREAMIADLRRRLMALEQGEIAKIGATGKGLARKVQRKARRRLSAATRAKYRLMGKYMGTVRNLPKDAKAKISAIREKSGLTVAIAAARKMAK